jgi:Zn finger protein HypA/HybF involved in hydrogenase expression
MHNDQQTYARSSAPGEITIRDVRCSCAVCGTHVTAWEGHALTGWCGNCGSYDVRALPVVARH